ncbi:MAG: UDP-N-acetylmuramoyl-L-alanine--D-glutamate ligase, partial [Micrococcales bacterium]|nr:UDP-N-acetylmuramoyl-L-alanine--D-glutamate ligase [Micrococcales bacterium]
AGHRGQVVGVVDGVEYIDDSKATNAHAARAALAGRPERSVVWICGGLAKGARFDELVASVAGVLAGVVVIGADPEPFTQAIGRHAPEVPLIVVDSHDTDGVMPRAVTSARLLAHAAGSVILAPAAASMDQFTSYAARGEAFARAVHECGGAA